MKKELRKISWIGLMLVVAAVFLTACHRSQSSEQGNQREQYDKYPLRIKNKFGMTVIKKKPKRIATIQWGNQDIPLALGVVPVGFSAANFGVKDNSGLLPWTKKQL
ncbi:hypothetical protein LFYK43_00840 [Ligilactobacillus salitolerans]|uniref:Uncharacterized protein n=1 Tax=Ligilactobacillus salitolerans TaxID=1808352 RepID=A0A401IQ36_9LACO|nr:hypothetical protein [Ligilactobacillus salitolerans]GBG93625.1 hypothetical protein LFYK43_00840 [Ligilactobacillus salitolerans]